MVAAVAALIIAVILPAMLVCLLGLHSIGMVAVMVLLFGTTLWVIVKDASWISFAALAVFFAVFITDAGRDWLRGLISGQFETQAFALFGLAQSVTLIGGNRLVRLNEDMPGYLFLGTVWSKNGNQMTRQWTDEQRLLPRLRDSITERQMGRLTRLSRKSSESW